MKRILIVGFLLFIGHYLVSVLRPFLLVRNIFDFGVAYSGPGTISIIVSYLALTNHYDSFENSRNILNIIFGVFLFQEVASFVLPEIIGTFDLFDLIYYFLGYAIVYRLEVSRKMNKLIQ